jgi:hypothetical protein
MHTEKCGHRHKKGAYGRMMKTEGNFNMELLNMSFSDLKSSGKMAAFQLSC